MSDELKYKIADGQLYINDEIVVLPYPAAEALLIQNLLIVRLSVPTKIRFDRNILALNIHRKTVWQVQEAPHGGDRSKPFMNIWLSDDGFLIAGNWIGVDYKVDLNTGQIQAIAFTK